ncbi:MAG: hypothetical protein GY830_09600 [Bacteroidetes bacterium]|nr:hypothetical protein [Bacteroidota bacterium]
MINEKKLAFDNISRIFAFTRYDIEQHQCINDLSLNIHGENWFRDILNLPRSSYYYQEKAAMLLIEDIYEDCPFYGGLRIYEELKESKVKVGRDRV